MSIARETGKCACVRCARYDGCPNDAPATSAKAPGYEEICADCLHHKHAGFDGAGPVCTLDPARVWESFWPLPDPLRSDRAPELDAAWLAARGIDPGAPSVLRCLRDEVLPLVRRLERERLVVWYAFLVHGCASGVPTSPDDHRNFVHLRFAMQSDAEPQLPAGWLFTRRQPLSGEIAGIRASALASGSVDAAWRLIGAQSEWVLDLIEQLADADALDLVRHARQFLHFFANMTQMAVQ